MIICPSFLESARRGRHHGSTNTGMPIHDQFHQIFRVPVRQPETAVRFRAPDLLRRGRAVNAVTGLVQADPRHADRIVRAGRQNQFVADGLQFGRFGKQFRVHRVIRIRARSTTTCNSPTGRFSTFAAMLHGKCASRFVSRVERLQKFFGQMDDDKRRLVRRLRIIHVGNFQNRSGARGSSSSRPGFSFRISSGCEWPFSATSSSSVS